MIDLQPIFLTFKLATITTVALLIISIPIAAWLANTRSKFKVFIETVMSMPVILPPTVLGFYLLIAFSPSNTFGAFLDEVLGIRLVFSFGGLVLASMIYSLPFMVYPIYSGLANLPTYLREASFSLGKGPLQTLLQVELPIIRPAILTGIILSFAHTIGEFGVVLMIGGSIPGKTRVASVAIYNAVESLNYENASLYSAILLAISFIVLLIVYFLNGLQIRLGK